VTESTRLPEGELPPRPVDTVPPEAQATGESFTLWYLVQIQRTLGKLEASVEQLAKDSRTQGERLDKISHRIYAAMVAGGALVGLLAWMVANLHEVVTVLRALPH